MREIHGYTLVPVLKGGVLKQRVIAERRRLEHLLLSSGHDTFFLWRSDAMRAVQEMADKHGIEACIKKAIIVKEKGA